MRSVLGKSDCEIDSLVDFACLEEAFEEEEGVRRVVGVASYCVPKSFVSAFGWCHRHFKIKQLKIPFVNFQLLFHLS
jgi:hypothetical protein